MPLFWALMLSDHLNQFSDGYVFTADKAVPSVTATSCAGASTQRWSRPARPLFKAAKAALADALEDTLRSSREAGTGEMGGGDSAEC